jgi:hypothetical protein
VQQAYGSIAGTSMSTVLSILSKGCAQHPEQPARH